MTVVAPVTAVTSAAIPVVVGLVSGERPPAVQLVGVGCALVAIALVSLARPRPGQRSGDPSPCELVGAVRRGVRAVLRLHRPGRRRRRGQAGLWPDAASQLGGCSSVGALLLARPARGWPRRRSLHWTLLAGPMDMTANTLYLLASRTGDLASSLRWPRCTR